MTIQLNTDKNIEGSARMESYISEKINGELRHFADHITRIEVHLSDLNAEKGGADDIQCKIEVRVKGMQPLVVTSKNASIEPSINDAADKMKAALGKKLGKRGER